MSRNGPAGKYNNFSQSMNVRQHGAAGANTQAELPTTLKCVFCNLDKPLDAFSNTQIQKATYCVWAPPSYNRKKKVITCKQCTASQSTHLTCAVCSKQKPLAKFSKSTRKKREKAICYSCSKKREEENIWDSNDDTDDNDTDDE